MEETILVVDDEPHIRRILQYLLEQQGFRVVSAANGRLGIEMARQELPDLILLDLMMPEMDGFEVCGVLRQDYKTNQIPIIIVTAKGEIGDRVKGLEGGANDYLIKPYDNKELLLRVRNTLDWSRSQRQANPLTGLPGNRAIESELQKRIESGEPFSFLYLDIDNFKAYNDFYGYSRGDGAIRFVAEVMRRASAESQVQRDFVGHIGGDDFCAITGPDHGKWLGDKIVEVFEAEKGQLMEAEDLARGFFEVRGRQGGTQQVPFPSLTIAVVVNSNHTFDHWAKVSDVAAELKALGKSQAGSVVVTERRTADAVEPTLGTPS